MATIDELLADTRRSFDEMRGTEIVRRAKTKGDAMTALALLARETFPPK